MDEPSNTAARVLRLRADVRRVVRGLLHRLPSRGPQSPALLASGVEEGATPGRVRHGWPYHSRVGLTPGVVEYAHTLMPTTVNYDAVVLGRRAAIAFRRGRPEKQRSHPT